jgi:hypothetical protein
MKAMRRRRNVSIGTVGRKVTAFVLVAVLSLAGTGTAFAGPPEVPWWQPPGAATTPDPDLITTYGVRDGSAGPDFLGVTNTNFDFTAGLATSPLQYPVPSASNLNTTLVGSGLAIWATGVNEAPNPYYQNLYYNAVTTGSTATQATTWTFNPLASWGDFNASPSNKGNVSTGDATIGGFEFDPDIIFGANKVTAWGNALPDGSNAGTLINLYFANNPWLSYDFDAVFTSNDATNIWGQIYTMGQLATVADGLKSGTSKITRYDNNSATASAVSYEKAIRGNLLYVASQIATGVTPKKTVAYLYSIDSNGVGYFFTPDANGLLVGDDTGKAPTTAGNPDGSYAANNGTIGFGYRATLPFVTNTFNSGSTYPGGIIMGVEDIFKANPACTVSALAPVALANVDVLIYNTTTLRGSQLIGAQQGRNDSGIDIDTGYSASFVQTWATNHGFTGAYIAGDDFFTSPNQGFMTVPTTAAGMSPLLYCQRNYTADKNAKAAWAFAQVYPALYDGNADATYGYWVDKVYHIELADVPMVATFMLNKETTSPVVYTQATVDSLEKYFTIGKDWWRSSGSSDPDWEDFAYYNGSTRASYYSGNTASEEPANTIGIFAPSSLWP